MMCVLSPIPTTLDADVFESPHNFMPERCGGVVKPVTNGRIGLWTGRQRESGAGATRCMIHPMFICSSREGRISICTFSMNSCMFISARMCLGSRLAEVEILAFFARLVQGLQ